MLILGRSENESLIIGEDITITVLSVKDNQNKSGIDAPKELAILRDDAKCTAAVSNPNIRNKTI